MKKKTVKDDSAKTELKNLKKNCLKASVVLILFIFLILFILLIALKLENTEKEEFKIFKNECTKQYSQTIITYSEDCFTILKYTKEPVTEGFNVVDRTIYSSCGDCFPGTTKGGRGYHCFIPNKTEHLYDDEVCEQVEVDEIEIFTDNKGYGRVRIVKKGIVQEDGTVKIINSTLYDIILKKDITAEWIDENAECITASGIVHPIPKHIRDFEDYWHCSKWELGDYTIIEK